MTMRKIAAVLLFGVLGPLLAVLAPAFACAPAALIRSNPDQAPAGSIVQLTGAGYFASPDYGPVEIRWHEGDTDAGVLIATAPPPSFTVPFTIPGNATGLNFFSGRQRRLSDGAIMLAGSFPFLATPPQPTPSPELATLPPGYRLVASDGGVFAFGSAAFFGSMGGRPLARPIVGMARTPSGKGYWLVGSDGGIFAFGDAGFFGSTGGIPLARPIVGMARTRSGQGYWLVGADGGIFAFGDAPFLGTVAGQGHRIVGMTTTPDGSGYALAGTDGTVWAYGVPDHIGGGTVRPPEAVIGPLAQPVVGIAAARLGGYWLAAADGGVFASGGAGFFGSMGGVPLARPIVGVTSGGSRGYWLVGSDGGIFALGDAPYVGSTGGIPLAKPIVGMVA